MRSHLSRKALAELPRHVNLVPHVADSHRRVCVEAREPLPADGDGIRGRRAIEEYLVEKRRSGELKPRSLRLVLETIYAQQIYYHEVTTGTQIRIVIF